MGCMYSLRKAWEENNNGNKKKNIRENMNINMNIYIMGIMGSWTTKQLGAVTEVHPVSTRDHQGVHFHFLIPQWQKHTADVTKRRHDVTLDTYMRLSLLITLQEAELWQFTDTQRNLCDQSCNCCFYWEQHPCLLINLKSIVIQWNNAIVLNCYFQIVTCNYDNICSTWVKDWVKDQKSSCSHHLPLWVTLWYINIIQY